MQESMLEFNAQVVKLKQENKSLRKENRIKDETIRHISAPNEMMAREEIVEEKERITEIDSELLDQNDSILDYSQQEENIISVHEDSELKDNNILSQNSDSEFEVHESVQELSRVEGEGRDEESQVLTEQKEEKEESKVDINKYLTHENDYNETQSVQDESKQLILPQEGLEDHIDNGPSTSRKEKDGIKISHKDIPLSSSFTKQSRHTSELDSSGVTEVEVLLESHSDMLQYMHLLTQ
eukprot:CAMPEP_0205812022 /NCGR_PEP_ID=MMETSP0205-20121125/16351_1 /ASSEMBLY_ACC=CAM_ASM_000278 /TAXON_ID=36767 /ORGANISM="Euplotes focardii, Strain TN1" /LENGTH=238 /DNA_ID=CAMNT_0053092035 /DNA_START=279 /DNA_END=992 /DNA_ORIENTATION=+